MNVRQICFNDRNYESDDCRSDPSTNVPAIKFICNSALLSIIIFLFYTQKKLHT